MQNYYEPKKVRIKKIIKESPDTKTFLLDYSTRFVPGQFFMVGLLGMGEAPISISGGYQDTRIALSIKKVGSVTNELHNLKENDKVLIRGPFGNGFDIAHLKQRDILIVAGGIGIAPLRPLIEHILKERKDFKDLTLLYGAKTQEELLFKDKLRKWEERDDLKFLLTVDNPTPQWKKEKGVVTLLLKKIEIEPENTFAVVCGPPVMIRYTVYSLLDMKIEPSRILVSLERHMKCGIGKCGHCYLGERFVCLDGPVFRYSEILKLRPKISL